jgi:hypothetical protein
MFSKSVNWEKKLEHHAVMSLFTMLGPSKELQNMFDLILTKQDSHQKYLYPCWLTIYVLYPAHVIAELM